MSLATPFATYIKESALNLTVAFNNINEENLNLFSNNPFCSFFVSDSGTLNIREEWRIKEEVANVALNAATYNCSIETYLMNVLCHQGHYVENEDITEEKFEAYITEEYLQQLRKDICNQINIDANKYSQSTHTVEQIYAGLITSLGFDIKDEAIPESKLNNYITDYFYTYMGCAELQDEVYQNYNGNVDNFLIDNGILKDDDEPLYNFYYKMCTAGTTFELNDLSFILTNTFDKLSNCIDILTHDCSFDELVSRLTGSNSWFDFINSYTVYENLLAHIVIPAEINGIEIKLIPAKLFYNNNWHPFLKTVEVPSSVSVADNAFFGCSLLS